VDRFKKFLIVVGMLIATTTMIAACGGDDDSSGGGGGSDDPIVIGLQADLSGAAQFAGEGARYGTQLAISQINANGGIHGRQLELIEEDSRTTPDGGALAAKALVQETPTAIQAGASSTSVLGAKPVIEQAGIPFLVSTANDDAILDEPSEWVFRGGPPPGSVMGVLQAKGAIELYDPQRVALVTDSDTAFAPPQAEIAKKTFEDAGVEIVAEVSVKQSGTDFTGEIQDIKSADPDVIINNGYPELMAKFVTQSKNAGLDAPVVGELAQVTPTFPELVGDAGQGYVGMWASGPYLTEKDPAMDGFRKAFTKEFPDASSDYPNFLTVWNYADLFALASALEAAGPDLEPDAIKEAMEQTTDFVAGEDGNFPYAFPIGLPRTWTPDNHNGSDAVRLLEIKGEDWVPTGVEVSADDAE
jgi:branched-chain amino acid transport system substrate-binding protein